MENNFISITDLPERIKNAAVLAGWTTLMPVQASVIPRFLNKKDLMVQAQTGSGKTGAFLLPLLQRINEKLNECQVMILVPTRELAVQVYKEFQIISAESKIKSAVIYGGVSYSTQLKALENKVHVVIGTPGRIIDHFMKKTLDPQYISILILDEADRMLSMGFFPDMKKISQYLPKKKNSYMFSATYPASVLNLAKYFLHNPEMLSLSQDNQHVPQLTHEYYVVDQINKERSLVKLLEIENPDSAIIFCNTKTQVHLASVILNRFGFLSEELSSDLSQKKRESIITSLKNNTLKFVVCSDIAARGIDIPNLSHVIQFDLSVDPEMYVHRAGRTGRAGSYGTSITLVNLLEKNKLLGIATQFNIKVNECVMPDDHKLAEIVSDRVLNMLEAKVRELDRVQTERIQRYLTLAQNITAAESEEYLNLIAMLLDNFYHEQIRK